METETTPIVALPLPEFIEKRSVPSWRQFMVNYQAVAAVAHQWRVQHKITNAADDAKRICVIPVGVQNAYDQSAGEIESRAMVWGYKWMHLISMWAPTMDTQVTHQIFHPCFLVDKDGNHPELFTKITEEDIIDGKWQIDPAMAKVLFPNSTADDSTTYLRQYLRWYGKTSKENGKELIVMPYQAMLGGVDHCLVASIHELIFFWEIARGASRNTRIGGSNRLSRQSAPQASDISVDHLGRMIAEPDLNFGLQLLTYDYVIIWGLTQFRAFVDYLIQENQDPTILKKVYLLKGCSVIADDPLPIPASLDKLDTPELLTAAIEEHPEQVNAEPEQSNPQIETISRTDAIWAKWAELGIHVIEDETVPMSEWPDMELTPLAPQDPPSVDPPPTELVSDQAET